jgi:quercetin dioxygenase-like cupin family protein
VLAFGDEKQSGRFTALEGELTVKRNGQTSVLHQGETAVIEPGAWHDW